ncbi:hypothetical protein [uncultured Draconibacterium sp.]|uniref:hypothetical protein n=1 Tax=uncultured Draconibacterium sp. TaxID=1573823 RepID=UPI002AA6A65B|nr:hypothetical protein [uncultured Draconibacterium sp.]
MAQNTLLDSLIQEIHAIQNDTVQVSNHLKIILENEHKTLFEEIWSPSTLIALAAIVLSLIGYFHSKRVARANVKPLLALTQLKVKDRSVIKIKNFGLGTAIIKNTSFIKINEPKKNSVTKRSLHDVLIFDDDTIEGVHKYNFHEGLPYYLEKDGTKMIWEATRERFPSNFDEIIEEFNKQKANIYYRIEYTDIFNKNTNLEPCEGCLLNSNNSDKKSIKEKLKTFANKL